MLTRLRSASSSSVVNCTEPGHIENSVRQVLSSGPHRYSFQTTVSYRCNPGYYLLGTSSISCQGDGTWDRSLPKCLRESRFQALSFHFAVQTPASQCSITPVLFCRRPGQWCSATGPACPPTPRSQATVGRSDRSSATAASASAPSLATQPECASWTASGAAHRRTVPVRRTQIDCVWAERDNLKTTLLPLSLNDEDEHNTFAV